MAHIRGIQREQITLFPEKIDDYIDKNNMVRFIDAFVNTLDLQKLEFKYAGAQQGSGRNSYDPADMLKLYLYGYSNGIRSSRKLEAETHRNVEVIWLIGKLTPDHKTISNFRSYNKDCFKAVFREFTLFCLELGLYEGKFIAIDGSKFKANNANHKSFNKKRLQRKLQEIDEKIDKYLKILETNDKEELPSEVIDKNLQEKINKMVEKKKHFENLYQQLEETGDDQISLTDPDSRLMKSPNGIVVGYNIQIATSEKHKLIIDFEVTNSAADQVLLSQVAIKAKEALGLEEAEVIADTGYFSGLEVKKCIDNEITPYVPKPKTNSQSTKKEFSKDNFNYDKEKDVYICPNNQELIFKADCTDKKDMKMKRYQCQTCDQCPDREKCTTNKRGRSLDRWVHEELMEQMQQRVQSSPELMKQRKSQVEHPFGTIKRSLGFDYQLLRRLEKVNAEFSITFLVYNMKRVMNIMSPDKLMEAISKFLEIYFNFYLATFA